MSETMDPPTVGPASRTEVAVAATGAVDLKKLDLTAVALAQFGDWRGATAKLKADNTKTVLDLSNQSKIDDAISLRQRTVKQPLADARRIEKALKSKLTETSKLVGAELVLIEAAYADASIPMTAQIDAAQAKIDAAKEAERQAKEAARKIEEKRLQGLRDQIDAALAKWVALCGAEDITAVRIGDGIAKLEMVAMPDFAADVAEHWHHQKAATLQAMDREKAAAVAREAAAAIEAQRLENERVAAENARIAAEAAAESARVAAAAAAEKAAAEALMEQARQMLAAAEAQRVLDSEKNTIKKVADEEIEAARLRAITPAANVATAAAAEGKADNPAALDAAPEAAPITTTEAEHDSEAATAGADRASEAPRHESVAQDRIGESASDPGVGGRDSERGSGVDDHGHGSGVDSRDADEGTGLGHEAGGIITAATGPAPIAISDTVRDRVLDLKALMTEARESRFPRQPKMGPEWFAAVYAAVDALVVEVA